MIKVAARAAGGGMSSQVGAVEGWAMKDLNLQPMD